MSAPDPDGPGETLYGLLPSVFRQADAGQGYPLLALMHVFGHVLDRLDAGIPVLEAGWFIETCPLDRVPAIGAMLGVGVPEPVRPEHRALVADALAVACRRGRGAALPRLVRGATGWYALCTDVDGATPAAAWPLGPSTRPGTVMPPGPAGAPPRPVAGLRVWRLPVFCAENATPAPAGGEPALFTFDPLGFERPLYTVPGTSLPLAAAAPITALPVPLTRAMLGDDLAACGRAWPNGGPDDSLLYGPARGLVVRHRGPDGTWATVRPSQVRALTLGAGADAPPTDAVAIDPERGLLAWPAGWPAPAALSVDYGYALFAGLGDVPDDPPEAAAPAVPIDAAGLAARLTARDGRSLDLRIGGGGTAAIRADVLAFGAGQSLRIAGDGPARPTLRFEAAPSAATTAGQETGATGTTLPDAAAGEPEPQPAPDRAQSVPPDTATAGLRVTGSSAAARPGRLGLNRLDAALALVLAGALDLDLRDATLVAPGPVLSASPGATGTIRFARCRTGSVALAGFSGSLDIADGVVGLAPADDLAQTEIDLPATVSARLARTTVLGAVSVAGPFEALDTLFPGPLVAAAALRLDHCFVARLDAPRPAGSGAGAAAVTRCGACGGIRAVSLRDCHVGRLVLRPADPGACACAEGRDEPPRDCAACTDPACAATCPLRRPEQSWQPLGRGPRFCAENRYPMPDFARPLDGTPGPILTGASDGDEIGVGNRAAPAARLRRLEDALRDNLLCGTGLDVRFET